MKRKGLSTIIATLIMIALVLVATGIVWAAINNMISNRTEKAQKCFEVGFSEKVGINEDYTCYNSTNDSFQFSISVWDVDLDGILVSVTSAGISKSYTLTNTPQVIDGLLLYPNREIQTYLPGKNGGLTYIATGFPTEIDSIKIAPIVGEEQCDVSDQIHQIEDCSVFI
jgi:flagellin-like protein